jgi:hypothetical protein
MRNIWTLSIIIPEKNTHTKMRIKLFNFFQSMLKSFLQNTSKE